MDHDTHQPAHGSLSILLEAGRSDVDVIDAAVALSVRINERNAPDLAVTTAEAERIAVALRGAARAAWTNETATVSLDGLRAIENLYRAAQTTGLPVSALTERVQR